MNTRNKVLVIVVLGAICGIAIVAFACTHTHTVAASVSVVATSTEPVVHYVALTAHGAVPKDLLIRVGEYVEFDSKDEGVHDVASGVGDGDGEHHDHTATGIESGDFKADEGYKVQFKAIGSYYFHDHLNPTATISVAVYDPNATSTPIK